GALGLDLVGQRLGRGRLRRGARVQRPPGLVLGGQPLLGQADSEACLVRGSPRSSGSDGIHGAVLLRNGDRILVLLDLVARADSPYEGRPAGLVPLGDTRCRSRLRSSLSSVGSILCRGGGVKGAERQARITKPKMTSARPTPEKLARRLDSAGPDAWTAG